MLLKFHDSWPYHDPHLWHGPTPTKMRYHGIKYKDVYDLCYIGKKLGNELEWRHYGNLKDHKSNHLIYIWVCPKSLKKSTNLSMDVGSRTSLWDSVYTNAKNKRIWKPKCWVHWRNIQTWLGMVFKASPIDRIWCVGRMVCFLMHRIDRKQFKLAPFQSVPF